ncbi:MAG: hypothetical protein N2D54_06300 [Chloroflexota bacterium]
MLAERIKVFVHHPDLSQPANVYSVAVNTNINNAWKAAAEIILSLLQTSRWPKSLVIVEAPLGLIPKPMLIHRADDSPFGLDVLELGNTTLLPKYNKLVPSSDTYKKTPWGEKTIIASRTLPSQTLITM